MIVGIQVGAAVAHDEMVEGMPVYRVRCKAPHPVVGWATCPESQLHI